MKPRAIAVTGLNATDNPGPGVSVIRALRAAPDLAVRTVGLAYDALEPGVYAKDLVDDVFMIPYPKEGVEALAERIRYIHDRVGGLAAIIPTLDAELPSFIALEPMLAELGIGTFLPSRAQFELRSKAHLMELGRQAGITVPRARVLGDVGPLYDIHNEMPFPLVIKGPYYGATIARAVDDAVHAFQQSVAAWGLPVIVQEFVEGDEYNVVAVGDGEGGLVGAVSMRKTYLTDKGKGWAGIAVKDPNLLEMAEQFMSASKWRGPCEVEVMKARDGRYHLMEINPRFPAWTFLSAGAGMNLPEAVARLAMGESVAPMRDFQAGTMFVRIAIDQIATLEDLQTMTTAGERIRGEESER